MQKSTYKFPKSRAYIHRTNPVNTQIKKKSRLLINKQRQHTKSFKTKIDCLSIKLVSKIDFFTKIDSFIQICVLKSNNQWVLIIKSILHPKSNSKISIKIEIYIRFHVDNSYRKSDRNTHSNQTQESIIHFT